MGARWTRTGFERGRGPGFTIVEILVAIGVLALIAVAVASIFGSVGKTVASGRRLSELNKAAAQLDAVLRRDIESITRDGFLVITHELADGGNAVPAFAGDAASRPRRVDQLMFFARGDFASARPSVYPGLNARGNEARIYYGHGQRRAFDPDPDGPYLRADLRDDGLTNYGADGNFTAPNLRLGFDPGPGVDNPNRFASDWTLLRHVTVLTAPSSGLSQVLPEVTPQTFYGLNVNRDDPVTRQVLEDRRYQVGLHPAAVSLFRNAGAWDAELSKTGTPDQNGFVPSTADSASLVGYGANGVDIVRQPSFGSGLIDVCSQTLREIAAIVQSGAFDPRDPGTFVDDLTSFEDELYTPVGLAVFPATFGNAIEQRSWMLNGLPTGPQDDQGAAAGPLGDPLRVFRTGNSSAGVGTEPTTVRMRYEPTPPALSDALATSAQAAAPLTGQAALQQAYRDADQEMLTRSVFLPRCTEFIVEWSYGWRYTDPNPSAADTDNDPFTVDRGSALEGQIIWFGRDRFEDTNGNGVWDENTEPLAARFYERRSVAAAGLTAAPTAFAEKIAALGPPSEAVVGDRFGVASGDYAGYAYDRPAGYSGALPQPGDLEASAFGYFLVEDPNGANQRPVAWPWPKLLRVTVRIASASDPSVEQTYQAVYELPTVR